MIVYYVQNRLSGMIKMPTVKIARTAIKDASILAQKKVNTFARNILHTRGGKIGSGMGLLIEALWGYFMNQILQEKKGEANQCELAWMYGHEYNDFACVIRDQEWDPGNKTGELFRIELKSMVTSADESKAHFDQLVNEISPNDLLVVIVWDWVSFDGIRVCPQVLDHFIDLARPIASLRDKLHIARGGSFVDPSHCTDKCKPTICTHAGEPLNENGKRERLSGPESTRVSQTVSYAANFGGLVRMLKTKSLESRSIFRSIRRDDDIANKYMSFIHRNFPDEEFNQYTMVEWQKLAKQLNIDCQNKGKREIVKLIREKYSDYMINLRAI